MASDLKVLENEDNVYNKGVKNCWQWKWLQRLYFWNNLFTKAMVVLLDQDLPGIRERKKHTENAGRLKGRSNGICGRTDT